MCGQKELISHSLNGFRLSVLVILVLRKSSMERTREPRLGRLFLMKQKKHIKEDKEYVDRRAEKRN